MNIFIAYDWGGRTLWRVDGRGIGTAFGHDDSSRTSTNSQIHRAANGAITVVSTEVTSRYRDGQIKSVTRDGVTESTYTYGINPDGSQYTQVYTGPAGTASPLWSRSTRDLLGHTIAAERPGFGGTTLITSNAFDAAGHLCASVLIGGSSLLSRTLYAYDELNAAYRTAQDIDLDGGIDLAGPDRVSESSSSYWYGEPNVSVRPKTYSPALENARP